MPPSRPDRKQDVAPDRSMGGGFLPLSKCLRPETSGAAVRVELIGHR
jgi:hypothetical protein